MGRLEELLHQQPASIAPPVAPPDWILEAIEGGPAVPRISSQRLLAAVTAAAVAVGLVGGLALAGRPEAPQTSSTEKVLTEEGEVPFSPRTEPQAAGGAETPAALRQPSETSID